MTTPGSSLHVIAHHRRHRPRSCSTDLLRTPVTSTAYPTSTLTDNGMVYTVRLAAAKNRGGRTALEAELARRGITQKNGKPNHPTRPRARSNASSRR